MIRPKLAFLQPSPEDPQRLLYFTTNKEDMDFYKKKKSVWFGFIDSFLGEQNIFLQSMLIIQF